MGNMQSLSATLILYLRPLEKLEGHIEAAKAVTLRLGSYTARFSFWPLDTTARTEQGSSLV